MRTQLRSWALRSVLALGLGFLTTVAIVYWLGAGPPWQHPTVLSAHLTPRGSDEATVHVMQARQRGALMRIVKTFSEDEQRWLEIDAEMPVSFDYSVAPDAAFDDSWGMFAQAMVGDPPPSGFREEARGWPLEAFWCWTPDGDDADPLRYHGGINLSDPNDFETRGSVMPYLPLWKGLLTDAAVYGGGWLLLLSAPGLVRRMARGARGCCKGCGYELTAELERCPECGRETRPASQAS